VRRVLVLALLAHVSAAADALAAERYDPRLRFRTLNTPGFSIHFHQGEEALARRLAVIVEDVAARVAPELGRANGRVHVILVDQNDVSNGWASPVPYNVIEITVAAPPGASGIGNTDDWLRLVFSHEYTHIVHLDRARGWVAGLRLVFGRAPLLYPNVFLPLWQIEGVAVYNESVLTGEGRVPTPDFRYILQRAAQSNRFEPLDRVNGGLVDWPVGSAHYAYGAYFHQYLADRFGAPSLSRLADATAGRLPYFGSGAFKDVYGRSLGDLWKDFKADTSRRIPDAASARVQLTHHGFIVTAPVVTATGRTFFAGDDPHGFPALYELKGAGGQPRRIADKFLGSRIAVSRSILVFDQLEIERNVSERSDLYAVSQDGGRVRRLTRNMRAADPDVSPDGAAIVCTVQTLSGRALATMPLPGPGTLGQPVTLVAEDGTDFSGPRWSPDGRHVAAERRRLGGPSEIVVVDVATRAVRTVVASEDARNVTPYWMPDGRVILFASDRGGQPFAIYAVTVSGSSIRRLEGTGVAVQSPVVSPDGRLLFVGYTDAGYDLFSVPLSTAVWRDVPLGASPAASSAKAAAPAELKAGATPAPDSDYRPWRTMLPQFWMPVIESTGGELSAGAGTAGFDALGRHQYVASVAWASSRANPDWSLSYTYDRWWPTLFTSVSDNTDPWQDGEKRTREMAAGALFTVRRVRYSTSTLVAVTGSTDQFDCDLCPRPAAGTVKRRALQAGWRFNNARSYGYSISREWGSAFHSTVEWAPAAWGSDATTGAAIGDLRVYIHAGPRHAALAMRLAGASSWGDSGRRRIFSASGSGPQPDDFGIGTDSIGLLRGFDSADVVGQHAAVGNVDFRFPVRYVQRGLGTLPFFARTLHAAIFADVGSAWSGGFGSDSLRRSIGAELSLDAVLGYVLPVTFTSGVAWRDDPAADRRSVVAFARIGRAF
jgi:WD40 repeat protein